MSKFNKGVRSGATAGMAAAGKTAGKSYGTAATSAVKGAGISKAMASETQAGAVASAKAVEQQTARMVTARNKAANAAGTLRVAQTKLNGLRASGKASAGQLAAAEERVAKAQRGLGTATSTAAAAQSKLVTMGSAAQRATQGVGTAASTAATSTNRFGSLGQSAMAKVRDGAWKVASTVPSVGNFTAGLRDSTAAASALTGRAGTMGGRVRAAMSRVGGSVSTVTGSFGRMGESVQGITSRVGGAIRRGMIAPVGGLMRAIAPLAGAAGLIGLGKAAIGAADNMDSTRRTLDGLYGSAAQARDMMGRLSRLSKSSPIEYQAYSEAAQQLAYMGLKGKDAEGVLRNVGSAIVASGKGSEAMGQASRAMLKMVNSGKVYAAQLNQISDTGVPVFDSLAKHFNTNVAHVREMVSAGKVSIDDVMDSIKSAEGPVFQSMIKASQKASGSMSNQWKIFKDNAVQALGRVATPLLGVITPAIQKLPGLLSTLGDAFGPVFSGMGAVLRTVWDALKPTVMALGGAFMVGLQILGSILQTVVLPPLRWLAALLRPLAPVILGIAVAFGAWYAIGMAVSVVTGAVTLARNAILGVRLAWLALQLAFVTSPIGFVVALIAGLAAAIVWLAMKTRFFQTIWNALKVAFAAVGQAFVWLYNAVFVPIGQAMGAVFGWLWSNVFKPVFGAIWSVIKTVGRIFAWLYNYIIHPIVLVWMALFRALYVLVVVTVIAPIILTVRALGAVFRWLWANAIGPAIRAIGAAAKWLWVNALAPAFHGIGAVAKWLWNNAIRPAFSAAKSIFRGLGSAASWLWNNAIGPAFHGIGKVTNWVWKNVLRPVFSAFGKVIHTVGDAFKSFGKIVTGIWNGIKKAVKGGVQMVIDLVWNNSLRKVAKFANKIPGVGALIPDKWVNNPIKLAKGGMVPGYQPGRDTQPAMLSPGEAVLVPGAARAIGEAGINALNKAFGGGPTGASIQGYANGGIVSGGKQTPSAKTGTSAETTPSAPDPALLTAADAAAKALTATLTALTTVIQRLTLINTLYNTNVATTTRTVSGFQLRTTALRNAALIPLSAQINGVTVPTVVRLRTHFGLLGNATVQLRYLMAAQWLAITNAILTGHNRVNASQYRLQAFLAASWSYIASTVNGAQSRMQGFLAASWNYIASVVHGSVGRQRSAFASLNDGMGSVRNSMKYTADWADWAYGRMREAAAKPVRWVLNYPFNRGIIGAWNKLNKEFSFKKHVSAVPVGFSDGGAVSGPGSGTSDSIPAQLSSGEFVVREAIAKRALPFLKALNAGNGEAMTATGGPRAHLAKGGIVADTGSANDAAIKRTQRFARSMHGKPYVWGGANPHQGTDCSGMVGMALNVARGNKPRRIGATGNMPWPGFRKGLKSAFGIGVVHRKPIGHTAATVGGKNVESAKTPIVYPGKHGADDKQFNLRHHVPFIGGKFVSGGGGGADIDPQAIVGQAFKPVGDMLKQGRKKWAGNTMGYESLGVADRANKAAQKAAIKKIEASMVDASGSTAGSPQVKAAVRAVARKYGWGDGSQWAALSWIIGKESGWNPNAANPSSSARGLFQKMTSIHGALEPTVGGQAKWGLNYIKGRYGNPLAAQRFWRAHNHYDEGGYLPPGVSTVVNETGRPEPVLNQRQWSALASQRDGGEQPVNLRVFLGDEEITDRIDARIEADNARTAAALRAGRR